MVSIDAKTVPIGGAGFIYRSEVKRIGGVRDRCGRRYAVTAEAYFFRGMFQNTTGLREFGAGSLDTIGVSGLRCDTQQVLYIATSDFM